MMNKKRTINIKSILEQLGLSSKILEQLNIKNSK